jgi:hypothetical protein
MTHSPLLQIHDTLERIISATNAKQTDPDQWLGHCPAHGSQRTRDLSITLKGHKILLHCFAECKTDTVCHSLGLTLADLFLEPLRASHIPRPMVRPKRIDRVKLAFRFELAALDRRLRVERILKAVTGFRGDRMQEEERDRLMKVVIGAYEDSERAKFLEIVADNLRVKVFQERMASYAA